jgi:riboflavin biosynthesis pyrimidine reductase
LTRFESYAARKEAEAVAAALSPWRTTCDAHEPDQRPLGNAWSAHLLDGPLYASPAPSADLPSTGLVFVRSKDGNTVAADPSALGGGETDKHVVYEGLSRVAADAVLAGAETIRGGDVVFSVWHPEIVALRYALRLPRHPIQIVATLRGLNLREGLLFNVPEIRVVILTVPACAAALRTAIDERPWIDAVVMERRENLRRAFTELRAMGIRTVSCVGGRTLAGQLLDAGLVQDLYLTTSAREGGEPNTPLSPRAFAARVIARKEGTSRDDGVTFEHDRL